MNSVLLLTIDKIAVTDIVVTFSPNHVTEHSKPGRKLDSFYYRTYQNKNLCVIDFLKEYLKRPSKQAQTNTKAGSITYGRRFKTAAINSMRRMVQDSFVKTSILKEHT